jgi:hypothetical protein
LRWIGSAGNPAMGAWDGRVVNLYVFFDPLIDARSALRQIAAILPTDAQQSDMTIGHNSPASKDQTGTCGEAVFTSAALGAATSGGGP